MRLAILFWFYKDPAVCKNRLQILRSYHPSTEIYGLYGGDIAQSHVFEQELGPLLNDFFCYPFNKEPAWKWRNGDFLLKEWFHARGRYLTWDTIVVTQWDMLLLGNVSDIFSELGEGEILISSVRPVEEVASHWHWTSPAQTLNQAVFKAFKDNIAKRYGPHATTLACHFVVACLPRRFLELYSSIQVPEIGFIEYRLPTYAKLLKIPFCGTKRFDSFWPGTPEAEKVRMWDRVILSTGRSIPIILILIHLLRRGGSRIFHPFVHAFPIDWPGIVSFFLSMFRRARSLRDL
jgi:hypothetical protein